MFRRIEHVQLAIPPGEETRAAAFWCGVLGFLPIDKPPLLARRGGAWFAHGDVQVHVGIEADFVPAAKAHPAFLVDDVDAIAAQLVAAGAEVRWSEEVPGSRRLHSFDPFGNRFEVIAG